jgi:hypothetical protein
MICAPPRSQLPSFQLELRTHCYIHPRSLLARWIYIEVPEHKIPWILGATLVEGTASTDFLGGVSFPSLFGVLHPCLPLQGLKFRGTHHSRVGSWVGESLWCRSSLLLIGWLWAQLSSGSTHCTYVRACVHRNMSLSPFLPKLWTMPTDLHIGKVLPRGLNSFRNICISLLRSPGSKSSKNVVFYKLSNNSTALVKMFLSTVKYCAYLFALLVCLLTSIAI